MFGFLCFRLISMLFWDKDKDAMLYAQMYVSVYMSIDASVENAFNEVKV